MPITFYPQINSESSLPVYVTGVGIGNDISFVSAMPLSDLRLVITSKGSGSVTAGEERISIPEGCGVYLDKSVACNATCGGDSHWTVDWISFNIPSTELKHSLFTDCQQAFFSFKRPAILVEDIRKILEYLTRDQRYGGYSASSVLYSMIIEINRERLDALDSHDRVSTAVASAISYINAHYAENLTLDDLCKVAGGLSEQYFCRLFKQHTGTRPIEHILRKRISVARSYLENTDMPISDIAKVTGFNNSSYFYRNFKKFTGVSPLACRQGSVKIDVLSEIISDA